MLNILERRIMKMPKSITYDYVHPTDLSFGDAVNEEIKVLRELYIFGKIPSSTRATKEARKTAKAKIKAKEKEVKKILLECGSEHEMTRTLHNLKMGKETLEEFIARKKGNS
jgi:hypothetical protein